MADAHADAVARAKAIAARLAGTSATAAIPGAPVAAPPPVSSESQDVNAMLDAALNGGSSAATVGGSGSKRGVEDALASLIPGLGHVSDPSKRARTDGGGGGGGMYEATKKIWIPTDKNPGYNYVGLLIGPGGSKQRELVSSSGGNVKISIRGKGSKGSEVVPGQPEEPLHVLLEGKQENVNNAEKLVRELLEDSEAADKEKARQLGSMNPTDDSNAGSGAGSAYTPKPVSQILGGMSGSTALSAYGPGVGETQVEEKIGIPNGVVGFIIGRGGESITSMQRRTGCRVQIQKEHEMAPGTAQRVITLTASTPEAIAACRAIIENMVKERMIANAATQQSSVGGGGTTIPPMGPGNNATAQMMVLQKALSEGQAHVTIQVPDADVGLIIGKGGMQIRNIQERSGANIQIPQVADADNPTVRTVNITHPNKEGGEFAKQMISEILATKMNTPDAMGGPRVGAGDTTIQVNVSILLIFGWFCMLV